MNYLGPYLVDRKQPQHSAATSTTAHIIACMHERCIMRTAIPPPNATIFPFELRAPRLHEEIGG